MPEAAAGWGIGMVQAEASQKHLRTEQMLEDRKACLAGFLVTVARCPQRWEGCHHDIMHTVGQGSGIQDCFTLATRHHVSKLGNH